MLLVVFQTAACFYKNCIYILQCIYKSKIEISDSGARIIKTIIDAKVSYLAVYYYYYYYYFIIIIIIIIRNTG